MINLPQKLINIHPYDPTEDKYKVKLDANESYFDLSDEKKTQVLGKIANISLNRYPDPASTELISVAAKYFDVAPSNLACGTGSDELISILVNAFNTIGDSILVISPDFSMYSFYAGVCEVKVENSLKNESFDIDIRDVIARAKEYNAKMVIFSNPCNPTGNGICKEDVLKIVRELPSVLVVADEAYMDFWEDSQSVIDEILNFDNLMVLKTLSKAVGLAGIRLGFAVANEFLIEQINKARSPFNVNALTQAVGTVVLSDIEYVKNAICQIKEQKLKLDNKLKVLAEKYPNIITFSPTFTNFCVLKTQKADFIYSKLLEKEICIRNFAKLGFLRITVGSDDENTELLTALEQILNEME